MCSQKLNSIELFAHHFYLFSKFGGQDFLSSLLIKMFKQVWFSLFLVILYINA